MSGEYGWWGRTLHSSVSKYVLTGLATWEQALSCWSITLSGLCSYCDCFHFNAWRNYCNYSRYLSLVMVSLDWRAQYTELNLLKTDSTLWSMDIRLWRRYWCMAGLTPWFSMRMIIVVYPLFIVSNNTL